jgi:type I restriction enzyme S subunit
MKLVALGEVCTIINGGTPDTKNSKFWDGKHAWITPAEMGNLKSPFLRSSRRTLTDEGMRNSSAQLLPKNSVIMSSRAPIGHLIINEIPMASNQGCKGIIPNETLNFKYLYYFLYANKEYLNELGSGTTFAEISGTKLKTVLIPLPSLEKQREIVEKLDRAFADIDLLEINLEQSEMRANQLLQSLLSQEFYDQTISPDVENPQSELTENAKWISLKDVCLVLGDGDWIESKDQSSDGIRLIQTGNVGVGVFKDRLDKSRWISESTFKRLRCTEIVEGDVLISRLPDPVGRACLLPRLEHKAITAVDCSIVRFDKDRMYPSFFIYYSQSSIYALSIQPLVSGSTRQRISREKLGTIQIPVPPMKKQKEIVKRLDIAFGEIERFKNQIAIKKDFAGMLRQSLLSQSFSIIDEKVSV